MLFIFAAALFHLHFWFGVSAIFKRNDVVDIGWAMGFILLTWTGLLTHQNITETDLRTLIISGLVTLWGFRLALYLFSRSRGRPEDYRYQEMRQNWGAKFWIHSYTRVYFFQTVLLVLIAMPTSYAMTHASAVPLGTLCYLGLALFFIGFIFEVVADYQMQSFRSNPANKGKLMMSGLWAYSRHPNYFGEITLWWGIFLVVLEIPGAWWTFVGPLLLTLLILKVSGVPLLEKKYSSHKDWATYKAKTNCIIPWPPRS